MEEVLIGLVKLSPVVAVLAFFVWKLFQRVDNFEVAAERREADRQASCDAREQRLAQRLTQVEDRQHGQMAAALLAAAETQRIYADSSRISAEATRTFSRALDRFSDKTGTGSGSHEVRGG